MSSPRKLVLSGGGAKGLAILGALDYLVRTDLVLADIYEYWGTSIGSVICLLLAIGFTPFEIFHKFFIQEQFISPDLSTVPRMAALCDIGSFEAKVRQFASQKLIDGDLTFEQLYKTCGKKLFVIGTNMHTMRAECFSVATHPSMSVIDAIGVSCDLPFIFTPKIINGVPFIDGGFVNNYPIDLADDYINTTLGICVFGGTGVDKVDSTNPLTRQLILWHKLLLLPIMELHRERLKHLSPKCINIELNIDISVLEFSPTQRKMTEIFSSGIKQCKELRSGVGSKPCVSSPPNSNGWEWEE